MSDEEKKEMPFITKAIIFAIITVVLVVFTFSVAYFVSVNVANSRVQTAAGETNTHAAAEKETEVEEHGEIVNFGEYTLNLNEITPTFLVCQISFELEPEKEEKGKKGKKAAANSSSEGEGAPGPTGEMAEKMIVLQDKVQGILRSKSKADLAADPKLELVKKDIKDAVNANLKTQKIKAVYFGKWMVQ